MLSTTGKISLLHTIHINNMTIYKFDRFVDYIELTKPDTDDYALAPSNDNVCKRYSACCINLFRYTIFFPS